MRYTLCFLFDETLENVLLLRKDRSKYAGKLNGIGGKVEKNEGPAAGAHREIREETGVAVGLDFLNWQATIQLPAYTDSYGKDEIVFLYCYSAIVPSWVPKQQEGETEKLVWYPVKDVTYANVDKFAGYGEVIYLVNLAHQYYKRRNEQNGNEH